MTIVLISVHLPKTAGSSFKASLESYYGDALLLDYADRPINQSSFRRNATAIKSTVQFHSINPTIQCVHGHFMPLKYRWVRTAEKKQFVVWLRDPVERLASHYHYWLREYDPLTAGVLRRKVVEEAWSLERFCFSSEMRNLYSKFFWGFPTGRFDFIGCTENYTSDLEYFGRYMLPAGLEPESRNVNPDKHEVRYIDDQQLRLKLEQFHTEDIRLYRTALAVSNKRREMLRERTNV